MARVLATPLEGQFRGLPPTGEGVVLGDVAAQHWNLLTGDLPMPVMVLRDRALKHNIRLMSAYAHARSVSLAPHVKTTMAPQIALQQVEAGAWAITVANVRQARLMRSFGFDRILIANQITSPREIRWVGSQLDRHDAWLCSLVDAEALVARMDGVLRDSGVAGPIDVMLEVGFPDGRSGVRSVDQALKVADAIADSRSLTLIGVEGYEGQATGADVAGRITAVDAFLDRIRAVTEALGAHGHWQSRHEVIVSAGGSYFFDRVVEVLGGGWSLGRPVRVVLRAGAYVAHDAGAYEALSPLAGRGSSPERLEQALELWAEVLSLPEPGLAILGFGKRDAPSDVLLPIARFVSTKGALAKVAPGSMVVLSLNDQHARVRLSEDAPSLDVGDLVGFGISHPCTAFDRWALMPVIDDTYGVVSAIRTYF